MPTAAAPKPGRPFALLAWALKPAPVESAILVITLLGVWLCELFIPFLLGTTVDAAIAERGAFSEIIRLGAAALATAAALYVFHSFYLRAETRLVARGTFRLRRHLYNLIIEQPLSMLSGARKGEIAQRLMSDTDVLDAHAIYLFADVPFSLLTIFGVFAVMAWMQPVLALLVSGVLVAAAILSQFVGRPLGTTERLIRHRRARLGGRLQETLDCFRAVKSFGRERFEVRRLDDEGEYLMRAEIAAGEIVARLEPLVQLMTTFGLLAVVWYGAFLVHAGSLTPGKLVAFIAYMELMREPIRDAGAHYAHYKRCVGTLRRIAALALRFASPVPGGTSAPAGPLDVEMKDVAFSWTAGGRKVLDGISITAAPGELIAVVGENGAGKSTLMDVLLGLSKPDCGTIRIGGVPLEEWDITALRRATSVLPQDTFLFHATIEENIRYGASDTGDSDEMEAAIESAGLAAVIARLPHGLKTMVGHRGDRLSGGERQRVALARALVGNPRILVLDEPATALDAIALPSLVHILHAGRQDRLTFIVSHHPETIAVTDRVIVLGAGRVARICKPSELGTNLGVAA
jgi:subfamily B ATP-binding cassette protein MsbA